MNRIKQAALCAVMAAMCVLLGGCVRQIEERPMADLSETAIEPGVAAPDKDGADSVQVSVRLYFLSEDMTALVPVTRSISAGGALSRVQAALEALLEGPKAGESGTWPALGTARSERLLEVSDGIATVDLPARARTLSQETLFAVRLAIANTLTEFSEISYVNVLIGGREEGFDLGGTLSVGTLTRVDDLDAGTRYHRMDDQRQSGAGITLLTTLYFPSADGAMLLPEVRSVSYAQQTPIEYLYTLLGELGKGANHALAAREVPAPMDYLREMPEIVRTEDGAYRAIEIRFGEGLDAALAQAGLTRGVYLAMLTDTLMGFVPGVEGLKVSIGEEQVTGLTPEQTPEGRAITFAQTLATRGDFAGYVGAPTTLYAMEGDGLARVQYVLHQEKAGDPRERLLGLVRLSQQGRFALPAGLGEADILAVYEGRDAIAVNLSSSFRQALAALTPQQERAAVYAMVNTLTEDRPAAKVVFFFGGRQVQTLAGALEMRGAFLRTPGMVVE